MKRLLLALVIFVLCSPIAAMQQYPRSRVFAEYMTPPSDLQQMIRRVDAVVRIEVTGAAKETPAPAEGKHAVTEYEMRVLEVLKARDGVTRDGQTIQVQRIGNLQTVESGFARFEPGSQYVLFLIFVPNENVYAVAWGPDGAYQLRGASIATEGKHQIARGVNGREASEFLKQLRAMK